MDICDLFIAINRLDDLEKEVIKLRFLKNNNSYKDVGDMLNISPEWVRNLELKAIKKLKKELK